jgi:hypothetical protein
MEGRWGVEWGTGLRCVPPIPCGSELARDGVSECAT